MVVVRSDIPLAPFNLPRNDTNTHQCHDLGEERREGPTRRGEKEAWNGGSKEGNIRFTSIPFCFHSDQRREKRCIRPGYLFEYNKNLGLRSP